ncbi:hypothetical protein ABT076_31165 [Streptomyces sp. NPDC002131]|uniref:WXG100-like domain-containing protein n=1 Tax=Streptomyces sp. NPDC002131 TaxID=3154535 RepID=UPI003317F202
MSVDMPPELAWVARLAVGQAWPKGDEDNLHALGQAWNEAALELKGISEQIGASGNGVLESVGGQVADEFRGFVTQLESTLPEMAQSAGQLGKLGKHTAVQVEYSKYMILGQLILLAAQIAQWAFFAPEVIPLAVTAARVAVKMILRRLLISVATGVAMNVGLDVAVQTIQFLKGDRTEWSTDNTVSAVVSGAIGGAMGGLFFGAGSVLAPKFAHSLFGKGVLGAATGLSTAGIMYGIYKSGQDEFGTSVSAGALGALGGGGKRRFGGKGSTTEVDPVHVNVPGPLTFDLPGLETAEKAALSDPPPSPGKSAPSTGGVTDSDSVNGNGTATRTGKETGGGDLPAGRTDSASAVHSSSDRTQTAAAAPHDGGLPGFATTLTTTPGTASSPSSGSSSSSPTGPAAARTTTPGSPSTVRSSGGSGTGLGPGTGSTAAPRPATTSTGSGPANSPTEPTRSSTTSEGPARSAEPRPSVRTETTSPTTGNGTATGQGTPTGARPETTATATASSAAATQQHPGPETPAKSATTGAETPASRGTAATAQGAPATDGRTAPVTDADTTASRPAVRPSPDPGPTPPPPPVHGPGEQAPAPRMRLDRTPRFVVRSSFEARRFTYQGAQVTDLTIRVAFRGDGGGHDTGAVWDRMADGVRQFLNEPGYHLPNGDRLHVTVLRARPGEGPHLTVDLVGRDRGMDQRSWWPDAEPVDFAHELAHQIGLRDEYRDASAPHRPAVEGSLQGDYRAAAPENLRQAGLRDRHLRLIGAVVGDLDEAPGASRPEHAAPAGLPHDEEWARAWNGATATDRSHVWVDPVSDPLRHRQDGAAAQKGEPQGAPADNASGHRGEDRPETGDGNRSAGQDAAGPRENAAGDRGRSPEVIPRMFGTPTHSPDNSLIMQPGYASGDQFGILASLLHDPKRHVLIARGPDAGLPGHDPVRDKSRAIAAFYRESGIPESRIHFVDVPSMETGHNVWPALNHEATRIAQQQWLIRKSFHDMFQVKELWGVTDGTEHVAREFSPYLREQLRGAWDLGPRHDPAVEAWLAGQGIRIPEGEKPVLVLWSRFSGKATQWSDLRSRMEHDTSFQGVRQLLRNLGDSYKAVIITGDPHPDGAKNGKWDELVRDMRGELRTDAIHHITGFWRGSEPALTAWGGQTRTGQFRLYDHLARQHGVQHLGFRSGNLEAVALIGHDVHYLEESGATGSHRMEAWHNNNGTGKTRKGGVAPGYERIVVADPPTASGRYAKPFEEDTPPYSSYRPADPATGWRKPVDVYGRERGFTHADLESIREELGLNGRGQGHDAVDTDRLRDARRRYEAVRDQIRSYRHLAGYDVERYLTPIDQFFALAPEEYPHGASQMYADFVERYLPYFPIVWETHRRVQTTAWQAYYEQQAQSGSQQHAGGDEVAPRAPQTKTTGGTGDSGVVAQSDGTAMMTRQAPASAHGRPSAEARAESSAQGRARADAAPEHPSLSVVPTTDGFAELRHLSSTGVTPADARARYGMPEANFTKFKAMAAKHRLTIDVRPTNPTAPDWLDQGKLPKPKDIKAKSINDVDVHLGARAEHRGLIGYFRPRLPERGDIDDRTWSRVEARFAQRNEEFETLAPVMEGLITQGKFKVEDGLVFGRDKEGGWREITGDHDVFDISTPGSTRLKGSPYDRVVGEMIGNDMAVMHGAHMDWEPSSPFSKGIFTKIVESHQEGGEPLLRFRPGMNEAELVHARPVVLQPRPSSSVRVDAPETRPETPPGERDAAPAEPRRLQPSASPTPPELHFKAAESATVRPDSPLPAAELPPAPRELPLKEAESNPASAVRQAMAEPEPLVVEPEGDPMSPPTPTGDPGRAGGPPEPVVHRAASPEPHAPPPARLGGRYQRSLAGIKITDAPGPEALRARVLATLPHEHRTDRQVVQKLDAEFDPATFRAQHDQMVNGGRRFRLLVGGVPHDVLLRAHPAGWRHQADGPRTDTNDGKGFERTAEAKRQDEPKKTSLTTSEAGLDLAPVVIRPVPGHADQLGMVTPSVKAGGVSHAADTSVTNGSESVAKTALTGPTDTYVSSFRYEAEVIGPDGSPLRRPSTVQIAADVTAEIARPTTDPDAPRTARADGWLHDRAGAAEGRPLDITGLDTVRDDVFRRLPREGRPDGIAHHDILDFLSPQNVVDGFEHAAGWGLTSKRLDLSDGGHAWLRLTLEPETSVHEGTVSDKRTVSSKATGEHGTGRTDSSTWSVGLNGGGARRLWESRDTSESSWLTVTGGYTYAHSQAHQEKGKQTFSLENSVEHAGSGDLIGTRVRFRVEVLRDHLSPGTDGLRAVRHETAPQVAGRDEENAPATPAGEVLRVRPRPAETPDVQDGHAEQGPPDGPGTRAVPRNLRTPLTAHRTAFVDVPGSVELEAHITRQLHTLAPGVLPPPDSAAGRVTPQAMENQRLLRERVSGSGLRAEGGPLLDGTFRITLDASHLPGLPGRTYEVVIRANTGTGAHEGAVRSTAKNTVTRGHASDKGVTRGSKHTGGVSGNVRRALNPADTVRAFGLGGADGSYGPARQTVAGTETQVKRGFQHKGQADAFRYPVTYSVMIGPHREGEPPGALPADRPADGGAPHPVREVVPADGEPLRVEVRRPEVSAAPRYLRPARLPQLHAVAHVADEAGFQRQAETALRGAYASRTTDSEPPAVPDLGEAVRSLSGQAQLRGLVSASHAGWANTLDQHVGDGRDPDTVGLSVRTRLTDLTYQETLSGDATLDLEVKASGSTTVTDQTSWALKGNLGPDFGSFPETAAGELTTGYQLRGGFKGKLGGQWDGADTLKQQTSTTRKVSHTGTWHVYRATAELSVAGRITDAAGVPHVGRAVRRDHEVLVLLSDEDVARLHAGPPAPDAAGRAEDAPAPLRATLLDQGVSGGALVEIPDTDPVLRAIDHQLRGVNDDLVPAAALPFADTFSPDGLAARYDELVGPGVLDRHVEETRAGRVVTEVLVRGITDGWRDDGSRSDRPLTRDVSAAHTVKGKAAAKWALGVEANFRGSVRPPVPHLNAASLAPAGAFEGGRGTGAESGVTTTVGHKTSGYGDTNARFGTRMAFEVTVTRRTEWGRFVHLTRGPETVGPFESTAWVPESLTETATAAPHPRLPDTPEPAVGARPDDHELGPVPRPADAADRAAWRAGLSEAHDLVGFDNAKALHDTAVRAQATPRPWGDGLLGQTGAYYSWALSRGADMAGWAARSTLPEPLVSRGTRLLNTFVADERLGRDHDLSQEQRLSLEEQFAIRQTFSGQSLPALFHRLRTADAPYRVPGTSVALSMEATGPTVELSRRDASDDELAVAVKGEDATTATDTYNWAVSPLDFSVLTSDPVVSVPLNTARIARDQSYDAARPVTRTPGTPGHPTPDAALPHGRAATEPGKAKISGPAALMRQPVRITVHSQDDQGRYGTPRTVTGHVFHWSTVTAPAAAEHPGTPAASSAAPSVHEQQRPSVHERQRPAALRAPAAAPRSRVADLRADEVSARAPGTAQPLPSVVPEHAAPPAAATPPVTRSVGFASEGGTAFGPDEAAHVDTLAAEVADGAVRSAAAGLRLPDVTITGHGIASVAGRPHFGRSVRLGAERADTVGELFARRLDTHLRALGSPLTSDALTITRESRGSDLPHGTDPAHDTPDARSRALVTVAGLPAEHPSVAADMTAGDDRTSREATDANPSARGAVPPISGERPAAPAEGTALSAERPVTTAERTSVPRQRSAASEVSSPDPHASSPAAVPRSAAETGQAPVRPEQWRGRRERAAWAVLRTERYDPARRPWSDRPAPGMLAGRDVVVRTAIARVQADDGRWVRNLSLHLPVRFGAGFGADDLGAYRNRLQTLLDTHVNDGLRLPGSGDQVHIDVEVEHRPDHPEAIEISRSDQPVGDWDQFTFPLGTREGIADDARALHEMLHYAGLPDRYHDPSTLFRRLERQSDRHGVMADIDTIEVPEAYARAIEAVTDSGPVLRDLPNTGEAAPGLSHGAARDALLATDAVRTGTERPPAAAPFAGRDHTEVERLVRNVLHEDTRTDRGRNWTGAGRPRLDAARYAVVRADGVQETAELPAHAYVVTARASERHITLETPGGTFRLSDPEDFAALLANDPHRPSHADIVLAVRGLPEGALGLPRAVHEATGRRVWTPAGGTLALRTVRTTAGTAERVTLSGADPHWETTGEPDPFASLRANRLVTDAYTTTAPHDAVLFQRLPATGFARFHAADPAHGDSPALVLPVQQFEEVRVGAGSRIEVSEDRTLAVDDSGNLSRHAYATQRAVDDANVRLAAAGSKVRLTTEPEVTLVPRREDGSPGEPLLRISPTFLTRSGRSDEEACRDFAQMVSGEVRASHAVFRVPGAGVSTGRISALDTAEVTGTHHLAQSLLQVADGHLDPADTGPAWASARLGEDDRAVGGQGGAPLPGEEYGRALSYEEVDDPRRDALTAAALRIGINEGAWAQVGEGYLVQSVNAAGPAGHPSLDVNYAKPGAPEGSHFGYHFASVVLSSEDGRSQLTLENHARVSRTRAEMARAVEYNLSQSADELRSVGDALARGVRRAEQRGATEEAARLTARVRLTESLVAAKEARDRGAPEAEQDQALRQAATRMLKIAPMIEGKAQWYFRSYSRRPGESLHETQGALLSDHDSAEANPLTLVVLHGHSPPLHRFITFEASGAMADGGQFKLGQLAEHLVRVGLWNRDHGLPLPAVRLTGHGDGHAPHLDIRRTGEMAALIREDLRARISDLLRERGAHADADAFSISVASGLRRDDGVDRGMEVTFEIDHWETAGEDV